ncbi:hypothetical protein Tco_1053838 [Tanacetum coccineum]|uniref:Uncharacterized protein n=1 Tax=Tanacetum coccineum TaxID=301880 RepID=A0ABQ5GWA0_9ASTR
MLSPNHTAALREFRSPINLRNGAGPSGGGGQLPIPRQKTGVYAYEKAGGKLICVLRLEVKLLADYLYLVCISRDHLHSVFFRHLKQQRYEAEYGSICQHGIDEFLGVHVGVKEVGFLSGRSLIQDYTTCLPQNRRTGPTENKDRGYGFEIDRFIGGQDQSLLVGMGIDRHGRVTTDQLRTSVVNQLGICNQGHASGSCQVRGGLLRLFLHQLFVLTCEKASSQSDSLRRRSVYAKFSKCEFWLSSKSSYHLESLRNCENREIGVCTYIDLLPSGLPGGFRIIAVMPSKKGLWGLCVLNATWEGDPPTLQYNLNA